MCVAKVTKPNTLTSVYFKNHQKKKEEKKKKKKLKREMFGGFVVDAQTTKAKVSA